MAAPAAGCFPQASGSATPCQQHGSSSTLAVPALSPQAAGLKTYLSNPKLQATLLAPDGALKQKKKEKNEEERKKKKNALAVATKVLHQGALLCNIQVLQAAAPIITELPSLFPYNPCRGCICNTLCRLQQGRRVCGEQAARLLAGRTEEAEKLEAGKRGLSGTAGSLIQAAPHVWRLLLITASQLRNLKQARRRLNGTAGFLMKAAPDVWRLLLITASQLRNLKQASRG